jgi:hypothetical protein
MPKNQTLARRSNMSERIDQFCENLHVKLTSIGNNMEMLKAKIDDKEQTAEKDVRTHLDRVRHRVEQNRTKVTTARATIKKWLDECKTATNEKVAEWKAKHEQTRLQNRAQLAEDYAEAAAVVASAAVDEAEQAALEAWLARKDTDSALGTKAA